MGADLLASIRVGFMMMVAGGLLMLVRALGLKDAPLRGRMPVAAGAEA